MTIRLNAIEQPIAAQQHYLQRLASIPGVISAAFVDITTNRVLDFLDSEWNVHLQVVARGFSHMLRAQAEVSRRFKLDEQIEAYQITLGSECHIVSPVAHNEQVFLMAVGDVSQTNIGLLRFTVEDIASHAIVNTI